MNSTYALLVALVAAIGNLFAPQSEILVGPRKALVYCPASDASGCEAVVNALSASFAGGVDRAYDGSNGTVDLKKVDLMQYGVMVVPSLADRGDAKPYALLRDATVADRLRHAFIGRVAFWSGTPDQGQANRPEKDALIRNLAGWAAGGRETLFRRGLVVLQDLSEEAGTRYDWAPAIARVKVSADETLRVYGSVNAQTAAGKAVLAGEGAPLAYANMATFGLNVANEARASRDATGEEGAGAALVTVAPDLQRLPQLDMLSTQSGGSTGPAVVTDKADYPPGAIVTITGSGWAANEAVHLKLEENPNNDGPHEWDVAADASGNFTDQSFFPDTLDLGVTFTLTAKGASGDSATWTFTDGNLSSATVASHAVVNGSCSSASLTFAAGEQVCASGSVTVSQGGNPINYRVQWYAAPWSAGSAAAPLRDELKTAPVGATTNFQDLYAPSNGAWVVVVCKTGNEGPCSGGNVTATSSQFQVGPTAAATSMSPISGSGAYGGTATLTATLKSGTSGVSGVLVSFTLNGAAVCGGSTGVTCPTTDASGVATLANVPLTENAGTYATAVGASFAGNTSYQSSSGTGALTVAKAGQTISFAPLPGKTYGDPDFTVSATATSGLTVSFAAGSSDNCTVTGTTVHIAGAGSCTITASQAGDGNYDPATSVPQAYSIARATPTVIVTWTGGAYGASGVAMGSVTGVGGENLGTPTFGYEGIAPTAYGPSATAPMDAGDYKVTASYAGSANYTTGSSFVTTTIAKATSTVAVDCPGTAQTYTGSAIEPCTAKATGAGMTEVALTPTYANNLNVGTASASASWSGDANHTGNTGSSTFTIGQAASTVVVSCPATALTYTGSPIEACTAKATGAGMADVTLTPTYADNINVGTALASASWGGDANHTGNTGSSTFTINKADATITVNGYTGVYDGAAHGATGSATGVKGEALTGLDLGGSFTNVPGGTANWTFTDVTGNYNDKAGTAAIVINKADATITVNGYTGVYDGAAHGATGSATGVKGEALTGLDLGGSFTNVPGGTANWTFTDATGNYNDKTGTAAIVINKADAAIDVSGYTGVYDGAAHGATGTAKGVGGVTLAGLDLGASYTNVPGGTANWTFTDATGNYNNASGSAAIVITKATPAFSELASPTIVYQSTPTSLGGKIKAGTLAAEGSASISLDGGTPQSGTIKTDGAFSSSFATGTFKPKSGGYVIAYNYGGSGNFESATGSGVLTVTNDAPVVTAIHLSTAMAVPVGSPVSITADFTDEAIQKHTATIRWDDSNVSTVAEFSGASVPSTSHTYAAPGVYTITVQVSDGDQTGERSSTLDMPAYFVVYDPSAGFVTGGGWINSPAGAYAADLAMTGKATFGFVAKYQKGATVPTGNTEFDFHAGNLNFKSTAYQWLVVSGSSKAQYKGTGTINGKGSYGFLITALDGGTKGQDAFRIKIWDLNNSSAVVYDNQMGSAEDSSDATMLMGGSIQIQTK